MIFASKTPRPITQCGGCGRPFVNGEPDPRCRQWFHEWDRFEHCQHNSVNPILTAVRKDAEVTHNWPRSLWTQDWIDVLDGYSNSWDSCAVDLDEVLDAVTPDHIDHARKVLTRLAALA